MGSATESLARDGRELYHGNQLLAGKVLGYEREKKFRQSSHTLSNIFAALDAAFRSESAALRAKQRMAEYLVLDALIGNTDRHHENWGVLTKRTSNQMRGMVAPSFDHASSLGRELRDDSDRRCRIKILQGSKVGDYSERGVGAIYWNSTDKRSMSPLGLVRRAVPFYRDLFSGALIMLDKFEANRLGEIVGRVPQDWMSNVARQFSIELTCYNLLELKKSRLDRQNAIPSVAGQGLTRAWFPVGRLDVIKAPSPYYRFRYTQGAEKAEAGAGFEPLFDFPDWKKDYESAELFPLFQNRVISSDRKDFHDYLQMLDLPQTAEPVEILGAGGGYRATDNFEVFPKMSAVLMARSGADFFCMG